MEMESPRRQSGTILPLILILITGILSGIVLDRQFLLQIIPHTVAGSASNSNRFQLLNEAWSIMQDDYVAWDDVDQQQLVYGAVNGLVNALGDTGHTRFLTPEELEDHNVSISAQFEGIGAFVEERDGNAVIVSPMDGSPAQRAGVQPGYIILAVDGEDVTGLDLEEVTSRIKGPAGTEVTVTFFDPDTEEVLDLTMTREVINIQNVTWVRIPGTNVAHLRISQFSRDVTDDLEAALREMEDEGIEGIALDLRNNPGGLLDEAVGVTSQFLDEGLVLQERDADGNIEDTGVKSGGLATDIPLVVLINEGSASASEITSGAIQDYGRAQLVGAKTFGTGTVLQQFQLSDGSALLMATAEWLTPNGRVIWHEGIVPDLVIEMPADSTILVPGQERDMTEAEFHNANDAQLLKALELLLEVVAD
jgi:carboxyl-terminal processing protease